MLLLFLHEKNGEMIGLHLHVEECHRGSQETREGKRCVLG